MKYENMSKEELVEYVKNINSETNGGKYGLVWEKEKEIEKIVSDCDKKIPILREAEDHSLNNNSDINNLLIEGDNFHALTMLSYTHREAIDVIYIDPPYNTQKDGFLYNDKYVDIEDGYRHSKWLNMMEKRLKIAKGLLAEDGIIFISIDDNEYAQLKLLCDRIFKEQNWLDTFHIQVRYTNKSLNEKDNFQKVMEYVLVYAKEKSKFEPNKPSSEYDVTKFKYKIKELASGEKIKLGNKDVTIFKLGEYEIKEDNNLGLSGLKPTWASGSILKGNTSGKFFDKYLCPRKEIDGIGVLYKVSNIGEDGIGYRYFTGPKNEKATKGIFYSGIPLSRVEELNNGGSIKEQPIVNYYDFSGDFGNIRQEGGVGFNGGKKPIKMIKQFINYHKKSNVTVLDFFAGSGSTGHAVLDLNNEDEGTRKFILCTNNEVSKESEKEFKKTYKISDLEFKVIKDANSTDWIKWCETYGICSSVTYPRIKNVINGFKQSENSFIEGFGSNLKYFKTEFIANSNNRDQMKFDLTEKCIPMLCIKEDTYIVFKETKEYKIYTNNTNSKYTCVYYDIFGNLYDQFIKEIEKIPTSKSLYIFSLGENIDEEELINVKNYTIEAIPYKILEVYKNLIKLSKEN